TSFFVSIFIWKYGTLITRYPVEVGYHLLLAGTLVDIKQKRFNIVRRGVYLTYLKYTRKNTNQKIDPSYG
ncbi:MAG: hypothetical protein COV70_03865, partial [Parcubacteria group bacterium CG11_big_fil_rev_8_21_14_0_20_39_22]